MPPKKTNIKIKHSKFNLYNKKKSKAQRFFKVLLTVVIVCGLGVLGYGLGKPLIKYLQERGTTSEQSTTSAIISSIINSQIEQTANESSSGEASGGEVIPSTTSKEESEPPVPQITDKIYYLAEDAALSEANLTAAVEAAKNSGCSIAAVTLKDTTGYVLYKTGIEGVKDTEVVTGVLTAAQIAEKITAAGLTPAARINTLMDRMGGAYVDGNFRIAQSSGGGTWHDNRVEKGGKPWLSPFKTEAANYIGNITAELSKAGFKHIICANTRYPAFHTVDISTYLNDLPLSDGAKRTEALWNVVDSAKKNSESNGAEFWLEMSGANIVAELRDCTDAELVSDAAKLSNVKLAVNYDVTAEMFKSNETANTSANSSNTSANVESGSAEYQTAKKFIEKANSVLGNAQYAVRLSTLSGQALEDVTKAFGEAGIAIL